MSFNLVARKYQIGDEKGIVSLLEHVFDGWPHFDLPCSSLEHWQWKFHQTSTQEKKTIALVEKDETIVAVSHSCPVQIKIGNRILNGNLQGDLAIHPDFRGMKLFKKMSELKLKMHAENGDNLNYSATGNPRVIEINIKTGIPTFPHPIKKLVRIQDIKQHTEKRKFSNPIFIRIGFKILETAQRITHVTKKRDYGIDFEVNEIDSFNKKHMVFWDKIKQNYDFIIVKTPDHLNWRYCDSRGGEYIVRHIEDDSGVLGYVVLRVNRFDPDYPEGYIVELIALPRRLDVVESLVSDAVAYFDRLGLNVVHFWSVDGHPYVDLVKGHGFLENMSNPFIGFNPLDVGPEFEVVRSAPSSRLFFHLGDTDWI